MSSTPSLLIPDDFQIYKDQFAPNGQTQYRALPPWLIGENETNKNTPTLTVVRHAETGSNRLFETYGKILGDLQRQNANPKAIFKQVIYPLIIGYMNMRPNFSHGLNKSGIVSAERLGQAIFQTCQTSGNTPTCVLCSPFLRTRQSMAYALQGLLIEPTTDTLLNIREGDTRSLATRFNSKINITIDNRLGEVDPDNALHIPGWAHNFIKTHHADIDRWLKSQTSGDDANQSGTSAQEIRELFENPTTHETATQFQNRLQAVLDHVAQGPGHTLAWSHGNPIKGLLSLTLGMKADQDIKAMKAFGNIKKIENLGLTTFAFRDNKWTLTGGRIFVPENGAQ